MPLFNSLKKYSNNIALLNSDGLIYYYSDLINFGIFLKKIITKKSFVVLVSNNSIETILLYITLLRNDCLVMIIDTKTNKDDFYTLIQNYKPNYLILPKNFKKINRNYKIFHTFKSNYIYKKKYNTNIKFKSNLSILLSTSGTMGSQKFVKITKDNIYSNTLSIIKKLKINNKDRAILNMPFSYSYMLSIVNTHIHTGGSIFVSSNSFLQRRFWNEMAENSITSFNGVPYIFETLDKIGLNKLKIKNIKYITQAGGKLNYNLNKKIIDFTKKNNLKYYTMYGQTEASPRIAILDSKYSSKKIGSIGKAIYGGKIWLENSNGKKIKQPNTIGELVYFGKNVSSGYAYNHLDLSTTSNNKFILKTGDLAYFDDDKFLYIKGRLNRLAKIYGIRFNLDELEQKLLKKGYNIVCVCINNKIYLCSEKVYSDKKLFYTAAKITMLSKNVFNFIRINKFPRNNSGKIQIKQILETINV